MYFTLSTLHSSEVTVGLTQCIVTMAGHDNWKCGHTGSGQRHQTVTQELCSWVDRIILTILLNIVKT